MYLATVKSPEVRARLLRALVERYPAYEFRENGWEIDGPNGLGCKVSCEMVAFVDEFLAIHLYPGLWPLKGSQ